MLLGLHFDSNGSQGDVSHRKGTTKTRLQKNQQVAQIHFIDGLAECATLPTLDYRGF
jgi:hypothetical protein